jgi:hypothetical protein
VLLLLFREVLEEQFLYQTALNSSEAFAIVFALMTFTFGIAGIGIIAWIVSRGVRPTAPVLNPTLGTLAALVVIVLISTVYIGVRGQTKDTDNTTIRGELVGSYQVILGPGGGCNGGKPKTYPDTRARIETDGYNLTAYNECDQPSPLKILDKHNIYMYGQHDSLNIDGSSITITETRLGGNSWQKIRQ